MPAAQRDPHGRAGPAPRGVPCAGRGRGERRCPPAGRGRGPAPSPSPRLSPPHLSAALRAPLPRTAARAAPITPRPGAPRSLRPSPPSPPLPPSHAAAAALGDPVTSRAARSRRWLGARRPVTCAVGSGARNSPAGLRAASPASPPSPPLPSSPLLPDRGRRPPPRPRQCRGDAGAFPAEGQR